MRKLKEEGGSDFSVYMGGMRPFMYIGEGGGGGNRQILSVVRVYTVVYVWWGILVRCISLRRQDLYQKFELKI